MCKNIRDFKDLHHALLQVLNLVPVILKKILSFSCFGVGLRLTELGYVGRIFFITLTWSLQREDSKSSRPGTCGYRGDPY